MPPQPIFASSLALFVDDDVLIVQRARTPMKGLWTLPGGKLKPGETAEAALSREIVEELGVTVHSVRHVVDFAAQSGILIAVFASRLAMLPTITPNFEIAAWKWLAPTQLRGMPTTPGLFEVVAKAALVANR